MASTVLTVTPADSGRRSGRPFVGVVIPNWNGADVLEECLASLEKQDHPNYVVLVVDNASHDCSRELIAEQFPDVQVHRCETNIGFTGACNLGASLLFDEGADYVLLLNNDTVAEPNLLSTLVAAAEGDARIGAVSPYIVFHDRPDQLWYGGGEVDLNSGVTRHTDYRQCIDERVAPAFETEWVNGCAFLLSANAFRTVGLLAPHYFASYEDVDLSLRVRQAGFFIRVATGTLLQHKVSAALGGKGQYFYYMARNRLIFVRTHGQSGMWIVWTARMLAGSTALAMGRLIRLDFSGFKRRAFEFLGVAAFLVGQRGKAPGVVYRYGSTKINA